jgi:hypothetical protein
LILAAFQLTSMGGAGEWSGCRSVAGRLPVRLPVGLPVGCRSDSVGIRSGRQAGWQAGRHAFRTSGQDPGRVEVYRRTPTWRGVRSPPLADSSRDPLEGGGRMRYHPDGGFRGRGGGTVLAHHFAVTNEQHSPPLRCDTHKKLNFGLRNSGPTVSGKLFLRFLRIPIASLQHRR